MRIPSSRWRTIQWLLLILTVGLIWSQSMLGQKASSSESGFVTQLLFPLLEKLLPTGADLEHFVRKAGHFTEFFLLGLQLCLIFLKYWHRIPLKPSDVTPDRAGLYTSYPAFTFRAFWPTVGLTLGCSAACSWLIAFLDETIPIFSGRGPMIQDVWLDLSGAVCGALLILLICFLRRKDR